MKTGSAQGPRDQRYVIKQPKYIELTSICDTRIVVWMRSDVFVPNFINLWNWGMCWKFPGGGGEGVAKASNHAESKGISSEVVDAGFEGSRLPIPKNTKKKKTSELHCMHSRGYFWVEGIWLEKVIRLSICLVTRNTGTSELFCLQ